MIIKIKVAVPINGKFFPNEMQIAFHTGLPFIESPHYSNTAMKSLQIKLKVIFKCLGYDFPKKKIFITLKNPNLVPKSFQFLELPLVAAVFEYKNLIRLDKNSYFVGSLDLSGMVLRSDFYQSKYSDFIKDFLGSDKLFNPDEDNYVTPDLFLNDKAYNQAKSFDPLNIFLPRIVTIALNLQRYFGLNILLIDSDFSSTLIVNKIKKINNYIRLAPDNFELASNFEDNLFFDSVNEATPTQLKNLKKQTFQSSVALIKPCPCGKLLTTKKCKCGVNYTKTFYKNFSAKFFSKFQIVIYLDSHLNQSTSYRFQWFDSKLVFDNTLVMDDKINLCLKKWNEESFFPIFEESDKNLLLSSVDQLEV